MTIMGPVPYRMYTILPRASCYLSKMLLPTSFPHTAGNEVEVSSTIMLPQGLYMKLLLLT